MALPGGDVSRGAGSARLTAMTAVAAVDVAPARDRQRVVLDADDEIDRPRSQIVQRRRWR